MAAPFAALPRGTTLAVTPFTAAVPDSALAELRTLLSAAKLPPPTYEGAQADGRFGVSADWVRGAVDRWAGGFDWRAWEARLNAFPQFTARVPDGGAGGAHTTVHFVALFSARADAVPLLVLHGWPGSVFEFLPILGRLRTRYSPQTLPYHVVVPSLPGYAFSAGPPAASAYRTRDAARVLDALMRGLGCGAYVAQGGDVGAWVAHTLASEFPACKAFHLNMPALWHAPAGIDPAAYTAADRAFLARRTEFLATGSAYAAVHATRPATLAAVLSSSPVALLAWMGQVILEVSGETPPLDTLLAFVSLYWLTQTLPRSLYPYRDLAEPAGAPRPRADRPLGYSAFPREALPAPRAWVATLGALVLYREHPVGGHFAALEQPARLLADVEDFVAQVWPGAAA